MWLLLAHPEVPTCGDCQQWIYSVDTWQPILRAGAKQARPAGAATPCGKCPKSDRRDPRPRPEYDPTPRTRGALETFCQVRAGVPMPDDALVHWYCGLIQWVYDIVDRRKADLGPALMMAMLGARK